MINRDLSSDAESTPYSGQCPVCGSELLFVIHWFRVLSEGQVGHLVFKGLSLNECPKCQCPVETPSELTREGIIRKAKLTPIGSEPDLPVLTTMPDVVIS